MAPSDQQNRPSCSATSTYPICPSLFGTRGRRLRGTVDSPIPSPCSEPVRHFGCDVVISRGRFPPLHAVSIYGMADPPEDHSPGRTLGIRTVSSVWLGFEATCELVNISIGLRCSLFWKLGVWLTTSLAMRIAYGHKFTVTASGHWELAWINVARASSRSSRIRRSATPFWWWALTPVNVSPWLPDLHASTH